MKLKHLLLIIAILTATGLAFWYLAKPAPVVEPPAAVDYSKGEIKSLKDGMAQKDSLLFAMAGQIADLRDSVEKLKNVKPVTKIVKKNEKVVPISDVSSKLYTSILSKRYSKDK